ncbi:hypothetical protein N7492_003570 [Penicillium capsulatum]|uniref:DUF2423 domain-containing protein n=1 Tax=Penicillium capsulatum TaxID=69766 RepID=A0A9W9INW2_9EURO|nr:hypothetical protein N7492_003570 [Penicillium capsulatum]KAJ6121847.1 hypothetical protein N7512_004312 [Penicillium capsulatum]
MAKSIRASVGKRNRQNLRKKVFGPVVDARTERLAAKLQEIASQPRPETSEKTNMETGPDDAADDANATKTSAGDDMDIDSKSSKKSQKPARVQKRNNRKPRNSIVFKQHPSKAKGSKRK